MVLRSKVLDSLKVTVQVFIQVLIRYVLAEKDKVESAVVDEIKPLLLFMLQLRGVLRFAVQVVIQRDR